MAGTLTISTLSDGTNSTSATNCIKGSAVAWCNYNGVANTIRASYNISSITVVSTGKYQFNFTNAMPDANYCALALSDDTASNGSLVTLTNANPPIYSTTSVTFNVISNLTPAILTNSYTVNMVVHR